jgi:ribose transport system substrate-binding protein
MMYQRRAEMMKRILVVTMLVMITALSAMADGKKLVIFSQCNNGEPYRAAQNASFKQLWGQDPNVTFQIYDAQQDNSRQISQIETAIRLKPDLLIVAPNERGPLSAVVGKAKSAGIPVICLERDIENYDNFTTWIMSDNYAIGKLVGQYIAEYLTQKYGEARGNVVELRGLLGVEGETKRENGAWDYLKAYPKIVKVQDAVANWMQSNARDRMTEILRAQPKIDIVYGHNDPMAIGAYIAAKALGREKDMIFIGVDGLNGVGGGIEQVKDGILAVTFVYPTCTAKAYEIGEKILNDPSFVPEKQYAVESMMVTPEIAKKIYKAN